MSKRLKGDPVRYRVLQRHIKVNKAIHRNFEDVIYEDLGVVSQVMDILKKSTNRTSTPVYQPMKQHRDDINKIIKSSFLYRLFFKFNDYIRMFGVRPSDNFEEDLTDLTRVETFDRFEYLGNNEFYRSILKPLDRRTEKEILFGFFWDYWNATGVRQADPNPLSWNPFAGETASAIYNFITFLAKDSTNLVTKIASIDSMERYNVFLINFMKFKNNDWTRCKLGDKIIKEKRITKNRSSKTISDIVNWFAMSIPI